MMVNSVIESRRMMRGVWLGVLFVLIGGLAKAQNPADSIRVGKSVLTTVADSVGKAAADTVRLTKKQTAQLHKIIPRQATIRSILLPGLGQAYNRQYWKIPIVYAGLITEVYLITRFNTDYLRFEDAYRTAFNDKSTGTNAKTAVVYVRGRGELRLSMQQLRTATDAYHRYRDLNVILMAAFWALNAVEANVAAHLKTFDMSDDLSLRVKPVVIPTHTGMPIAGVGLTVAFK